MIQAFTAATREIDDAEACVAEVLAALDLKANLRKNALGLISCFSEFEETGVLKAVCDALPFDCIGATSCLCASGKEAGQVLFTVTVLTSDDCDFKTVCIPVAGSLEASVDSALSPLFSGSGEKPAMFLSYFPLLNNVAGDVMLAAVDKVTNGIPLFGTITLDHNPDYSTAKTIHNGGTYREAIVLGAVCGKPDISFGVAALDETKIRSQKAIITASEGNILIGVNGKTVLEYLEEIGLTKEDLSRGLGILPLAVGHRDGTKPVIRSVFTLTPEGYAVCGGDMPVGATLGIGHIDKEDVLRTTREAFRLLQKKEGAVLGYSCMARYLVLGADNTAEADKVIEAAGDTRYLFAYSGGEICPLPDSEGKLKNMFHNYTAVFCSLG